MKNFFSAALVLLASSIALAVPAVGDFVKYSGTAIDPDTDKEVSYTVTQELVKYSAITDEFTTRTTEIFDGQSKTYEDQDFSSELLSNYDMATCAADNGKQVTIKVAVGTFAACEMALDVSGEMMVWAGDVPFGMLKMDLTGLYSLELVQFRKGSR